MYFPVLTSLLILIIIMHIKINRSGREMSHQLDDFWEMEERANSTRKQSLDDLAYVVVPDAFLEYPYDPEDIRVNEALRILRSLKDSPTVNLTGLTNTELKLRYGTANITKLTEYDQNYTLTVRSLNTCAAHLCKAGHTAEAEQILEFAIDSGSDISASYDLLSDIYLAAGRPEKIKELSQKASSLKSLMREPILNLLDKKLSP